MSPRLTDPFFRVLYTRLSEEIENRRQVLAGGGSSVRGENGLLLDPVNTAIKYERDVATIEAYNQVLRLGLQIDRELFGTKHNEDDGD